MDISSLPAANYSILLLAGILSIVCFLIAIFLHKVDTSENEKCKVEFFQETIGPNDVLYSISMTIKECICHNGISDIILRIRGTLKDSPLILYRDEEGTKFNNHSPLTLGIALPFSLGHLVEVDIACDNDCCEENEPVICISDIYIRELPRWNFSENKDSNASWKKRAFSALFNTCGEEILAWVCLETVTNSAGAGIFSFPRLRNGTTHTLRAREACLSLPLTKENEKAKKRAKISYKSLHYFFSLFPRWHDIWSDFSALDQLLVIFLDNITGMIFISTAYAFALEEYLGADAIIAALITSLPAVSFTVIEEFSLLHFFSGASKEWLLQNSLNLVHVLWIACVGALVSIPMSLLWCRLFRFIGGKGFNSSNVKNLEKLNNSSISTTRFGNFEADQNSEQKTTATSLMLRTLECRSVHTGSNVSSSRRLRVEPMISNCPPDNITARSIAYVRTKMAKLREDDFGMAALSEPKGAKVLHESHTQSTDAPQMPMPSAGPDGNGEVVGVARYCQRLVQQATQHIRDRSVIAECYEVANEKPFCGTSSTIDAPKKLCCPQQCNKSNRRCRHESFSNTSFFTEEDAASVKEMISKFSLQNATCASDVKLGDSVIQSSNPFERGESELYCEEISTSSQETETNVSVPVPSAGILKITKKKSKRTVKVKNSGSETRMYKNSGAQTSNKRRSNLPDHGKRVMASPTIQIGWDRCNKAETGDAPKKMQYCHKDVPPRRCKIQETTAPFPSGYSLSAAADSTVYGVDKSSKESVSYDSESEKKQEIRLKGPRFKLVAFFVIAFVQFLELYFVTAYENPNRNYFYKSNETPGSHPAPGRMHAALLSCILFMLLYFLVTVHLIAFVSFAIELSVYWWISRKTNDDPSTDYDEQYTYSV